MTSGSRKRLVASLVLLIAIAGVIHGADFVSGPAKVRGVLADRQAAAATRSLMARLATEYGERTWSGQYGTEEMAYIYATCGLQPVIIGNDLMDYSPSRVAFGSNPTNLPESCIAMARNGHIITLSWHWNAPSGLLNTKEEPWWRGFYTKATTFDVAAALADTNSVQYTEIIRDIDAIAVQLKRISDADVPILWRPLHEAPGGGFWWGAKGPQSFKQLWRLLFRRLTIDHGLHNLIWVFSTDRPNLDSEWYPGDDVVDIIGVDAYPKSSNDILLPQWQMLKTRFNGVKPIALTEFGGVPDIESMQRSGVWWCYFASWYGTNSEPAVSIRRTYQSLSIITLNHPPAASEKK